MNLLKLRKAVSAKRVEWNKHSLERMLEQGISRKLVFEILLEGEEIENYPDDKPYPSALIFWKIEKTPLHVVAAFDEINDICYIITAYHPDEKHFEKDFKTRKWKHIKTTYALCAVAQKQKAKQPLRLIWVLVLW